ncbi:Aldehyde/histidinol dehydrogenase [Crepidotus variabilis]|uniref:Aldehyde/histidinol dehydrogenase n=1 Tax=Crepidotus variabilis TaxID=179855 RepID=A0A9P6EHL1_9AGAR|nr:Aldehyde/histidinol dehydrogenase [Crepidotus variabilis]
MQESKLPGRCSHHSTISFHSSNERKQPTLLQMTHCSHHPKFQQLPSLSESMAFVHVQVDPVPQAFADLRATFLSGKLESTETRKILLSNLLHLVNNNLQELEASLKQDLGRHSAESRTIELLPVLNEIQIYLENLESWSKPERLSAGDYSLENLRWFSNRPRFNVEKHPFVQKVPKGVVLVISPSHYPVRLTLGPLAAALAAGCTVFIKASDSTSATSSLLVSLMDKLLDRSAVRMVNGVFPNTLEVIKFQWDHIFYAGGGSVAQNIALAASEGLKSYTVIPSAKCPVVIDPSYDLQKAAQSILWGKIVNAGQSYTAPDYVVIPQAAQDDLVKAFLDAFSQFFPHWTIHPGTFTNLIFPSATFRISSLLQRTNGDIVIGGRGNRYFNEKDKYHCPTLVTNVKPEDVLMKDEIFGPILPIVPMPNLQAAIAFAAERANQDHPLTVAIFTNDEEVKRKVFEEMKGGVTVIANDTFVHPGGSYDHLYQSNLQAAKKTFETFSTHKTFVNSATSLYDYRYPPYTETDTLMLYEPLRRRLAFEQPLVQISTLNQLTEDVLKVVHSLQRKETIFGLIVSLQVGLLGTRIVQAMTRAN